MKTEEKLDKIVDSITKIQEDQHFIKADLHYHIKRTDLLEGFMKGLIKFLLACVSVIIAIGIKKIYM
jgi:hypothetical protein